MHGEARGRSGYELHRSQPPVVDQMHCTRFSSPIGLALIGLLPCQKGGRGAPLEEGGDAADPLAAVAHLADVLKRGAGVRGAPQVRPVHLQGRVALSCCTDLFLKDERARALAHAAPAWPCAQLAALQLLAGVDGRRRGAGVRGDSSIWPKQAGNGRALASSSPESGCCCQSPRAPAAGRGAG